MVAHAAVVLLVDIGNTHTHAAVANGERIVADARFTSESLVLGQAERPLAKLLRLAKACPLYTSDAADEGLGVDLGGPRRR